MDGVSKEEFNQLALNGGIARFAGISVAGIEMP
jgi:hypothetical protein